MAFATTPMGRNSVPGRQAPQARGKDAGRAREFRIAKRHSVLVRVLKVLLPTIAAGIVSLYLLPSFFKVSIDKGRGTAIRAHGHLRGRVAENAGPARQRRQRKE